MRVAELLRHKGGLVRSVDRHVIVSEAIRLMAAYNVGALLVFEEGAALLKWPMRVGHGSAVLHCSVSSPNGR
jgi:hypothetical protein